MLFKRFVILSSGGPPVRWSVTIYAILKEGIIGNIHVKLYEVVQEEMSFNEKVYARTDGRRTKFDHKKKTRNR